MSKIIEVVKLQSLGQTLIATMRDLGWKNIDLPRPVGRPRKDAPCQIAQTELEAYARLGEEVLNLLKPLISEEE